MSRSLIAASVSAVCVSISALHMALEGNETERTHIVMASALEFSRLDDNR